MAGYKKKLGQTDISRVCGLVRWACDQSRDNITVLYCCMVTVLWSDDFAYQAPPLFSCNVEKIGEPGDKDRTM